VFGICSCFVVSKADVSCEMLSFKGCESGSERQYCTDV